LEVHAFIFLIVTYSIIVLQLNLLPELGANKSLVGLALPHAVRKDRPMKKSLFFVHQ
jgi:hypothetical protein